ncbi:MAG: hypothetical protein LBH47_03170 [Christensenellaceae bacterium]|jgi:hypothetical protein|nr:hypothetical protein [Christensenellaceae bacterium]
MNRDLLIPAIVGFGLYAQQNNINLSNNAVTIAEILMILTQEQKIQVQTAELARLNFSVYGAPYPYFIEAPQVPYVAPYTSPYASPYSTRTNCNCCSV